VPALRSSLDLIRNLVSYQSVRGPGFWITTALIALLLPSPLAAPLIVARLRRPNEE
jgi:hypothetical protein